MILDIRESVYHSYHNSLDYKPKDALFINGERCPGQGGPDQTSQLSCVASFFCYPSARKRQRYPHGPGIARPFRCFYHHDLYPCSQQARHWSKEPGGQMTQSPLFVPALFSRRLPPNTCSAKLQHWCTSLIVALCKLRNPDGLKVIPASRSAWMIL